MVQYSGLAAGALAPVLVCAVGGDGGGGTTDSAVFGGLGGLGAAELWGSSPVPRGFTPDDALLGGSGAASRGAPLGAPLPAAGGGAALSTGAELCTSPPST